MSGLYTNRPATANQSTDEAAIREVIKTYIAAYQKEDVIGLMSLWSRRSRDMVPMLEALYEAVGLPPTAPATASRVAVPVYRDGKQVGRATSTTWSTTLKKMIALATIDAPHFAVGTRLELEITVEAVRHRAAATIVKTPFFNPPRKTATPPR